jgi:aryl-alcohol dehydrogenase-like predicted oxidoreductase
MKYRKIGTNGPLVSAIGFGAMPLSGPYGPVDDEQSIATIHRAIDLGITLIDTAERYGEGGHNELVVGRALEGRRDSVILATKFGNQVKQPDGTRGGNGSPANVRRSIDGNLQRLGVDYVDMYYLHRVDPITPIEETVGAMAELVIQGKVRYLGLSEASPDTVRRAQAVHPIAALQTEYSIFSRDPEEDLLAVTRELGIGFVAYSPLSRGLLSGQIERLENLPDTDRRRRAYPRYQGDNLAHNMQLVRKIKQIADGLGITVPQLALAWLLHKGEDIVPIPGTTRAANAEANGAAVDVVLDADTIRQLDDIGREVRGERAAPDYLKNVDTTGTPPLRS